MSSDSLATAASPALSPAPAAVAPRKLNILILGSGGREHALLRAALKSPLAGSVAVAPGNAAFEREAPCHPLDAADAPAVVALAKKLAADLVVVGPEAPLAAGVVDALEDAGIAAYGPRAAGSRLEASKVFTKEFLARNNIPTALGRSHTDLASALADLRTRSLPVVVKADGLAAGKGVVVAHTLAEAEQAAADMLEKRVFGDSGARVLIEDFLDGEEASIMLMVCRRRYVMLPASQDHKRVGDGDTGPNTGGMGAYAPADVVTPEVRRRVVEEIVEPTLAALEREGIDYRGTLYVGIMVTAGGPKVVEFNVRFGDPECEVLLPLLADDPVRLMWECATGSLGSGEREAGCGGEVPVKFRDGSAVIITLAAGGYPGTPRKGDVISLPAALPAETQVIAAGVARDAAGNLVTAGGRVLGAVAFGATLREAVDRAYALAAQIHFDGMHYRRDIAARQLNRRRAPAPLP
ncbi:MAG: phosphoribosylamine--glycine ligase [Puniceicoccales bacterium]|jgi:phosphoribosylamine--glycine ligase|nr:phosphoribosylamine--glycine ligase [Puniceicoccales bacterium]